MSPLFLITSPSPSFLLRSNIINRRIIEACGSSEQAYKLLMLDHIDHIVDATARATANIKFDKVVVWDSGNNATGNFVKVYLRPSPSILSLSPTSPSLLLSLSLFSSLLSLLSLSSLSSSLSSLSLSLSPLSLLSLSSLSPLSLLSLSLSFSHMYRVSPTSSPQH